MALLLVRHADAGDPGRWAGPDAERPLSGKGRRRADELARELGALPVGRILSSPAVRCVDTVQPLAAATGLEVERHPALAEGSDLAGTWALLEGLEVGERDVVVCSHGDVLPAVLDRLTRRGIEVDGSARRVTKGSVWRVPAGPDGRATTAAPIG